MAEAWILSEEEFPAIDDRDDSIYEEIEAPKYVDLLAPEKSLPYDASWFCTRIGCDQNHEEIDPDTINKDFFLRVMAARSPNIRLIHKSNCQRGQRRCPKTEPVKCVNDHKLRFAEKLNNARLKAHPISSLRGPQQCKRTLSSAACVKDGTTPGGIHSPKKKNLGSSNISVTSSMVNKKLTETPKKWKNSTTLTPSTAQKSQICSPMKKPKESRNHPLVTPNVKITSKSCTSTANLAPSTAMGKAQNKKICCALHEENVICNHAIYNEKEASIGELEKEKAPALDNSSINNDDKVNAPTASTTMGKAQNKENHCALHEENVICNDAIYNKKGSSVGKLEKEKAPPLYNSSSNDDDKENAPTAYYGSDDHHAIKENGNTCVEQFNHPSHKGTSTDGKCCNEKFIQGVKYKRMKSTNPKPFRFRTDERGILKEANLEKRIRQEHPSRGEIKQTITLSKKKLETNVETAQFDSRSNKPKLKLDSNQRSNGGGDGKTGRLLRRKEEHAASTTPLRVRKPATIPIEPVFQKMHVPRSCTRREMQHML